MKILVTGANGQVGREVAELALQSCIPVCGFDRQSLDITQPDQIEAAIVSCKPDFIFNCAAYTAVDKAEDEKELAFAINRDGAQNLANACKHHDIPLLHISTDYVFDGTKETPYTEEDQTNPLSVYGESKWQGEEAIRKTWEKHIILRTSWVFGKHGNNFVKTMLKLAESHDTLRIVSDQHGAPTAAADIARTLLDIARQINTGTKDGWGTYHYSGIPATNWADFARTIFTTASSKYQGRFPVVDSINASEYMTRASRPSNSQLDCTKLEENFRIILCQWRDELDRVI